MLKAGRAGDVVGEDVGPVVTVGGRLREGLHPLLPGLLWVERVVREPLRRRSDGVLIFNDLRTQQPGIYIRSGTGRVRILVAASEGLPAHRQAQAQDNMGPASVFAILAEHWHFTYWKANLACLSVHDEQWMYRVSVVRPSSWTHVQ